ncbi:hypothetical protein [Pedobacter hartonius]|uniref:Outer membrane protein beta-barrel domain-containing protein n=1 Tax=Pedobacter hartonius TaxID=425514 RepID=A0A1H4DZ85_9SPHI|nr:hypothetical protein [Pedobacter hartonius]SEA78071.1 hypothetical protein SAMN05443550_105170 [Pedobacter hartonius]
MGQENEIDELFKRGLNDPEIPFNELDWAKMERKLDEKKKRKIIPLWVFAASGAAATVLIFLFWVLSGPAVSEKSSKDSLADHVAKPGIKKETPLQGADSANTSLAAELNRIQSTDSIKIKQPAPATEKFALSPFNTPADQIHVPSVSPVNPVNPPNPLRPVFIPLPGYAPARNSLAAGLEKNNMKLVFPLPVKIPEESNTPLSDSAILAQKAMALAMSKDPLERINHTDVVRSVQKKMDDALSTRPDLILSAMAAPDISSGQNNKSSRISSNLGVLATYALGSKFSLTSGAIYARKLYNSGGTAAGGSTYAPAAGAWEVKADCNVLDIPLNVNYKLINKKKLSVTVNTGLSSYFMLKEKYDYIVDQPGQPQQVTTTEYSNQNQHIFGIANLALSFDHQISQKLSVGVQPFAKLPLTGIGNNDVNLKSTGISFSLNIGLFPAKKPGKLAASRYSSLQ